jgi:hypothetical protein
MGRVGQSVDSIYLFIHDGAEVRPSTEWVYYRVTHRGDEDHGDGLLAISRVSFPGCVDLPDNPGDLSAIPPARTGYESAELSLLNFMQNRYGVDPAKSLLIGSALRLARYISPCRRPTDRIGGIQQCRR